MEDPVHEGELKFRSESAVASRFAVSRAKGANLRGIKAFFATIAELVSAEEGQTADH